MSASAAVRSAARSCLVDDRCQFRIAASKVFDLLGELIEPHGSIAHGLGLPCCDPLVEPRQLLAGVRGSPSLART